MVTISVDVVYVVLVLTLDLILALLIGSTRFVYPEATDGAAGVGAQYELVCFFFSYGGHLTLA